MKWIYTGNRQTVYGIETVGSLHCLCRGNFNRQGIILWKAWRKIPRSIGNLSRVHNLSQSSFHLIPAAAAKTAGRRHFDLVVVAVINIDTVHQYNTLFHLRDTPLNAFSDCHIVGKTANAKGG